MDKITIEYDRDTDNLNIDFGESLNGIEIVTALLCAMEEVFMTKFGFDKKKTCDAIVDLAIKHRDTILKKDN